MTHSQPYTVVVVGYNSQYWLKKHLTFYLTCEHLIIVDNASTDNTCNFVHTSLPQAKLISNNTNRGFGAACNQGIKASTTPFVVLLNPDCICTHEALSKLLFVAQADTTAAIVAPQVLTKTNSPEVSYRMGLLAWAAKNNLPAQGLLCVEFVTGACFLMNKALIDQVKGFDEAYFMYYEDEDLCLRLRKAGFSVIVEPASVVQHFARSGSKQSGWGRLKGEFLRGRVHTQSKLRFYKQYASPGKSTRVAFAMMLGGVLVLPVRLIQAIGQPIYLARLLGRFKALLTL
jgi:N-acetylglucosaminyl-diphospho-decaprenol L-rhamnosyltransferase